MTIDPDPNASDPPSEVPAASDSVPPNAEGEPIAPILSYAPRGMPAPRPSREPITIATFAESWEAHLALGKLLELDIPAALNGENFVAVGGGLYNGIDGGIKLRVPAEHVEQALAALPRRVRTAIVRCPKCRSTQTRQADFSPGVKILFLVMLGLPYLFVQRPWACLDCGQVWRPSPQTQDDEEEEDEEEEDEDEDEDEENEDESESIRN